AAITPGNYSITINGLNGLEGTSLLLTIIIEDQLPEPETLSPADGINNSPSAIDFFWSELVPGRAYDLQVSTSTDFSTLVYDLSNQIIMPIRLQFQPNDTYHWRVKGTNDCGEGEWSSVATFSTAPITCIDKQASDLPITISTSGTPTVVSTLPLEESSTVASVKVLNLNIEHSWVGDLEVSLTSPSSTIVPLIDRPGIPESNFGCDGNNILVDLFDDASETADDLDLICENTTPTIEGQFQPVSPLDVIIGEPAGGNWTLTIQDNADDDGGVLRNWTLELCTVQGGDRSLGLDLPRLTSCQGDPSNISLNIGADFDAAGIDLSIANLPSGVNADFSTNPALPGQSVQLSLNGEVAPGVYYLQLVGADGSTTSSSTLIWEVQAIPADLDLLQPVDDAPNVLAGTFLNWTASARAQNYRVELATDPAMQNVLWEETTEETFAILPDIVLDAATYWQVTAFNDCGNTISPVFSFNSVVDQLFEVTAQPLEVFPNPTTGRVQIKLPTVNGKVKLSIFNTSGQSMRELVLENALPVQEVDLSAFANGVYWLRLTDGQDLWYSKIMLIRE
ncbi:MAG: proprotein convertase P-domain-containing protein, partial [Bacteroidota bacterium]